MFFHSDSDLQIANNVEQLESRLINLMKSLSKEQMKSKHLEKIVHKECEERAELMEKIEQYQEKFGII